MKWSEQYNYSTTSPFDIGSYIGPGVSSMYYIMCMRLAHAPSHAPGAMSVGRA